MRKHAGPIFMAVLMLALVIVVAVSAMRTIPATRTRIVDLEALPMDLQEMLKDLGYGRAPDEMDVGDRLLCQRGIHEYLGAKYAEVPSQCSILVSETKQRRTWLKYPSMEIERETKR